MGQACVSSLGAQRSFRALGMGGIGPRGSRENDTGAPEKKEWQ